MLLRQRADFLALLERIDRSDGALPEDSLPEGERAVLEALLERGILAMDPSDGEGSGIAARNRPGKTRIPAEFAFQTVRIDVGFATDRRLQAKRIGRVFDDLSRSGRRIGRVCLRFTGSRCLEDVEALGQFIGGANEYFRELVRGTSVKLECEIRASLARAESSMADLEELLDRSERIQLTALDPTELDAGDPGAFELGIRAVEELYKAGFTVHAAVPTVFAPGIEERVAAWAAANGHSGVDIEPLFLDPLTSGCPRALSTDAEVEHAIACMEALTERLGTELFACNPWRDVLFQALLPGSLRETWAFDRSSAFITADGRWARSEAHAAEHLFVEPRGTFPHLYGPEALSRVRGPLAEPVAASPELPSCEECPVAPICDKYWSAERDILLRTGRRERARLAARFACLFRKSFLPEVVRWWRDELADPAPAGAPLRARFSDGNLVLEPFVEAPGR